MSVVLTGVSLQNVTEAACGCDKEAGDGEVVRDKAGKVGGDPQPPGPRSSLLPSQVLWGLSLRSSRPMGKALDSLIFEAF